MKREFWVFLFVIGLLLFTGPIITGIKSGLAAYLFIAWPVFIAVIFIASRFSDRKDDRG